jgi:hypothetical protein
MIILETERSNLKSMIDVDQLNYSINQHMKRIKEKSEGTKIMQLFQIMAKYSLIIVVLTTLFTNLRGLKKLMRKIKFFLGFGLFKWEAQATFSVRDSKFLSIKKEEESIIQLMKSALEENNEKVTNKSIEPSYDRFGSLKLFVEKYVAYFDISVTDLDEQDDDGFSVKTIKINTKASLRYKDSNKAINGLLLDFYYQFEQKYSPVSQKYDVTIAPVDFEKNYMKKQFINELTPDEISSFSINNNSKRAIENINEKNINFVTNRRENLNYLIKSAILVL